MDKLFEDSDFRMGRFACNCSYPFHSFDVTVEKDEETGALLDVCFYFNNYGHGPWKYRLKQIWKLLKREDAETEEFYIREQDLEELIELLQDALRARKRREKQVKK